MTITVMLSGPPWSVASVMRRSATSSGSFDERRVSWMSSPGTAELSPPEHSSSRSVEAMVAGWGVHHDTEAGTAVWFHLPAGDVLPGRTPQAPRRAPPALLSAPALQLRRTTPNGPVRIASASQRTLGGPRESDYGPHGVRRDESCAEVGGCSGRLIKIRDQRARQAGGLTHRSRHRRRPPGAPTHRSANAPQHALPAKQPTNTGQSSRTRPVVSIPRERAPASGNRPIKDLREPLHNIRS